MHDVIVGLKFVDKIDRQDLGRTKMSSELLTRASALNHRLQLLHHADHEYDLEISAFLAEFDLSVLLVQLQQEQTADDQNTLETTFQRIARSHEMSIIFAQGDTTQLCRIGEYPTKTN